MIICRGRTAKDNPKTCTQRPCRTPATQQCDYVRDRWGRTCDKWLCKEHAYPVPGGWNKDHCIQHHNQESEKQE